MITLVETPWSNFQVLALKPLVPALSTSASTGRSQTSGEMLRRIRYAYSLVTHLRFQIKNSAEFQRICNWLVNTLSCPNKHRHIQLHDISCTSGDPGRMFVFPNLSQHASIFGGVGKQGAVTTTPSLPLSKIIGTRTNKNYIKRAVRRRLIRRLACSGPYWQLGYLFTREGGSQPPFLIEVFSGLPGRAKTA